MGYLISSSLNKHTHYFTTSIWVILKCIGFLLSYRLLNFIIYRQIRFSGTTIIKSVTDEAPHELFTWESNESGIDSIMHILKNYKEEWLPQ